MADFDYGGNVLPKHSIYPSSKILMYLLLLVLAKLLRAVGLFLAYDLLKLIPVVIFLFIIKAGAAIPLVFLQKPFSNGKVLSKNQWFRIARHAFVGCLLGVLWMFGLSLCGPLRTILLYEHSDVVVIAWASAMFTSNGGGPSKMRGAVCFLVALEVLILTLLHHLSIYSQTCIKRPPWGYSRSGLLTQVVSESRVKKTGMMRGAVCFLVAVLTLLLFDHDEKMDHLSHNSDHRHSNILTHGFYHLINLTGWSDHKGGVLLLFLTLCLHVGFNSAAKKLSVDVGGAKRLHALSTLLQALILGPWAFIVSTTTETQVTSWLYILFPLGLVILFVFIVDYYIEAVAANHLQPTKTAEYSTYAVFLAALFLGLTWNHPYTTSVTAMGKLQQIVTEDHVLSWGVMFSLAAFILATRILLSPSRSHRANFIGFSAQGTPLYSFTGDLINKTSQSLVLHVRNALRQVLEDVNSRKIFYFLCINLMFTFVELIYGVWTNSLGLISDGFHMLFDCSALVMGLYASVVAHWKATRIFSYGFDRVEIVSGFVNGLFLVVIAIFVFSESLHRLMEPPEINTDRLLVVSVLGLLVNMMGILAFRGSHGHSHGGGHGHSHGGHGHSHGGHNTNMEGVFLHVLADTLGSVGVIISSLLIENFGWNIADPICSLFIATMILLSVLPLLKETSQILLLRSPSDTEEDIQNALQKMMNLEEVIAYRDPHFWYHTSSRVMGTIHVQISHAAPEQKLVAQVSSILKEAGLHAVTVQVEKDEFYQHLSGLGSSYDQTVPSMSFKNLQTIKAI